MHVLLDAGANANARTIDRQQATAFHLAIQDGKFMLDVVKLLVSAGVRIGATDNQGQTALDLVQHTNPYQSAEKQRQQMAAYLKRTRSAQFREPSIVLELKLSSREYDASSCDDLSVFVKISS